MESASGVQAGGRTGLTALTIGVLFLLALFLAPLAGAVPAYATAPALLYVAGLMLREIIDVDWRDVTEATPAALTAMVMPFTYSIANGLAFGFMKISHNVVLRGIAHEIRKDARRTALTKARQLAALLGAYRGVNEERLWENLAYFLERVVPVAEESGVRMAIHPDDPPFLHAQVALDDPQDRVHDHDVGDDEIQRPLGVGALAAIGSLTGAIREFTAEMRLAMAEREDELRVTLGLDGTHDLVDTQLLAGVVDRA